MKDSRVKIFFGLMFMACMYSSQAQFVRVEKLPPSVNTEGEEVKPVFGEDNTMYFVRTRHSENTGFSSAPDNEDVWETKRDENGGWNAPIHESSINDKNNNSILGVGKDGHYFLLNTYQSKKHLKYGIAVTSKLGHNNWKKPEFIEIPELKYKGDFYDFSIAKDETVLIISIEGPSTLGKEDLYVSLKKEGNWTKPLHMGSVINSTGYEMSPFLSDDKKTLYFSSNGRGGQGDADVFVTTRLDESWTNWSQPKNMGNMVNSPKMDCYFTIAPNGDAYFASNRDQDNLDLYRALIKEEPKPVDQNLMVSGYVTDKKTSKPLKVELNVSGSEEPIQLKTDDQGYYQIGLKKNKEYTISVLEKGYHEYNQTLKTPDSTSEQSTMTYNIALEKLEAGTKINLERLYFVVSTDTLIDVSLPVVEKLAKILTDNPDIKISIEGHTDNTGNSVFNEKLSLARATRIKTLLVERGITKRRMKVEGFGARKPLVKNLTEEDKQKNRRVEFVIIE